MTTGDDPCIGVFIGKSHREGTIYSRASAPLHSQVLKDVVSILPSSALEKLVSAK